MKSAAAKEKSATAIARPRATGSTRSYLQTRVRVSRLYEAAFILAIIELTRRLHQAYAQAYDKQAADWLLPQNSRVTEQPLTNPQQAIVDDLVKSALKLLESNQACFDYVRGGSKNSPITELGQLWANHRFNYFDGYGSTGVAGTRGRISGEGFLVPNRIVLYTNFFKNREGGEADWAGVGDSTARIETILHELRHETTGKPHPPSATKDSDPDSDYDYDKNIYEKCFGVKVPPPRS